MTWVWDNNATKRRMTARAERRLRDAMQIPRLRAQAGLPRAVPPGIVYHAMSAIFLGAAAGRSGTAQLGELLLVMAALFLLAVFILFTFPEAVILLEIMVLLLGVGLIVGRIASLKGEPVRTAQWRCVLVAEYGECLACDYRIADIAPDAKGQIVCPECGAAWRLPGADDVHTLAIDAGEPRKAGGGA